ncbi:MAG: phosphotransferase [Chloroflexi bacterium]|nr:phosphotransferase [Chloroflexota bacterium]
MIRERLGPLPHSDPAHSVLVRHVFPQLGVNGDRARIRAYRLGGSNAVFEYEDRESGAKVIGKFYGRPGIPASGAITNRMLREFRAIERMRGIGLDGHPHQVMRAFAAVPEIGGALFLEHLEGETLGVVLDAVAKGKQSSSDLYSRLTALAYFLATMHNRTAREEPVAFATDVKYLRKLSRTLRELGHLGESADREFRALGERWMGFGPMWEDRKVLLHGDATPANFFLRNRGSRRAAEPFIGHFLWEYACHFPDRHDAFAHICARIPFHLATTLLRIARNEWVADDYRAVLLDSARDALSSVGR